MIRFSRTPMNSIFFQMNRLYRFGGYTLALATLIASMQALSAAPNPKEQQYLQILQSSAALGEKAVACKNLAIYGSDQAVPILKPLLADTNLSSWARIALQAIPGDASDKALRDAAENLNGRLLVGVINTIGVRRDAKAIDILAGHLKSSNIEVAAAAAEALGRVGGSQSAAILSRSLSKSDDQHRTLLAQGAILCAEGLLRDGKASAAAKLYDQVRGSGAAQQKVLEATRGAILARGDAGIPLLLEQLRSDKRPFVHIGLRTARELPGAKATAALAAEMEKASVELRPLILLALGDRNDAAALPAITKAARDSDKKLCLAAIEILDRRGEAASAPVLLQIAAEASPEIATPASAAVGRMAGQEVDPYIIETISKGTPKLKAAAILLASQRRIESAMAQVVPCAAAQQPEVRNAALQYLGSLGKASELPVLTRLLAKSQAPADLTRVETALVAVSGRVGSEASRVLLPLMEDSPVNVKVSVLQALAACGGAEALKAVAKAASASDENLQDEAIRTLATWPNNWPEDASVTEPLLRVAQSGPKDSHKILATRGYLEFLQNSHQLSSDRKAEQLKAILPLITRTEEKRLALAVAKDLTGPEALGFLLPYVNEPALVEDASTALIKVAIGQKDKLPAEERAKALRLIIEKSSDARTKSEAQKLIQ
jgi:HEAT repeat protein